MEDVNVRVYRDEDWPELVRIHSEQEPGYLLPELGGQDGFISKLVVEDDTGRPIMAILCRLTAEAYLLLDPAAGTPTENFQRFVRLHRMAEQDLVQKGLDDVHAWIPPAFENFGRRLQKLGWIRERWPSFCRYLRG